MSSSAAIINWNSGMRLRRCIESLIAAMPKIEICVVDNASEDDSLARVQEFRDRATFITNSVNQGFAAAINQAFRATSTPYVLVLNPDVQVSPGSVSILEEVLIKHPDAGAVGGYVNEKYMPKNFPGAGTLVLENLGLGRITGRRPPLTSDEAVEVDQPAAAALLIRRDAYEAVGGFDPLFYPAWYEDVDFCRRLNSKGWKIYFAPNAHFLHEGGYSAGTMGPAGFANAYYGNQLRYARKHFGSAGSTAVRVSIAAGMIGRMIARPARAAAYGKALIGVLKGQRA